MLVLMLLLLWNGKKTAQATQECGSVVNNTLKSPGYPDNYPNNMDCNYTVPIPHNLTMKISFLEFHLEDETSCQFDYLKIVNDEGKKVGKFCGGMSGYKIFVPSGNQVLITFHSDQSATKRGFLVLFTATLHTMPEPVAFYPLNEHFKAAEKDNSQPEGILHNVDITNGPYNEPGGAYMFFGTQASYIELENKGGLDTRYAITLMCWVRPQGENGLLFSYEKYDRGVAIGIIDGIFFNMVTSRDGSNRVGVATAKALELPTGVWTHVAATYNTNTGNISLYINGYSSGSENSGFDKHISTDADTVRIGAGIKGAIAKIKVYDVALNEAEIRTSIRQVPPTIIFPNALLATEGGILSCLSRGTPPIYTALKWNSTVLVNTTNTATIRLKEEGNYTCQAVNQYGTDAGEQRVSFTTKIHDFVISEGYPDSYKRNFDNASTHAIPEGLEMKIFFHDFFVEYAPDCNKDYLRITDGKDITHGVYCGNKTGKSIVVSGDQVRMVFHSDDYVQRRGYVLVFTLRRYHAFSRLTSAQPIIYIVSGVACLLLLVLSFILGLRCYRRSHPKATKKSARSVREIVPLDKWELLPGQIEYGEELGRGAFGVVYKASLKRRVGIEVFDSEKILKPEEPCQVVAVKVLQDDPSEQQKEEFLQEIEQMKLLGAHQNIVSLVGCCTLQDPKFLVIEYVPFGDLLHWLRRRRRKNNQSQATGDKEERKCYEDKETFSAREEVSECGQVNTAIQEKDHDQEEMNQPLPGQTLQMMESSPPRDNRDITIDLGMSSGNVAKETRNDFLDHENMEMLSIPSTSQGISNSSDVSISTEIVNDDNDDDEEVAERFNTQKLFSFAWQIAKGMNHLAEKDFIHRDLAARNILVGSDGRVKVSDFGLMRQIYEDLYSGKNTKKLPVKWMAPESIFDSIYTIKSDVWSFGILLWEMATMGGVPYPTLSNSEVSRLLKTGYRMERPDMCCDEVYELMSDCWKEDPSSRPSFSELIDRLEVIMTKDVPYCDL